LNKPTPTYYASDHVFELQELACKRFETAFDVQPAESLASKLLHSDQAEDSFGASDPPGMNFPHARSLSLMAIVGVLIPAVHAADQVIAPLRPFIEEHCADCHDGENKKGGLDLDSLNFVPADPVNLALWVKIYDRAHTGEMPPKKKPRPAAAEMAAFTAGIATPIIGFEHERMMREGRSTQRRLNRYEYENALRDLLEAPWLQVKAALPEDGEEYRFNKVGDRLDVSHVQLARYLGAADSALREAMATHATRPPTRTVRYYARDQPSFIGPMGETAEGRPERGTFPVLGFEAQPAIRAEAAKKPRGPVTVGAADPAQRELEGMGVLASAYEPIEPIFENFRAPVSGRYKLRFKTHSIWVGPGKGEKWYVANVDEVSKGRRSEPVTVYAESPPNLLRRLGGFDTSPEPGVHELEAWLIAGETVRGDASRLFRSRPGADRWRNPYAEKDGQPGLVFRWLEVEGPFYDAWPTAGQTLLFGELSVVEHAAVKPTLQPGLAPAAAEEEGSRYSKYTAPPGVEVISESPHKDAARLMLRFLSKAYRRPVGKPDVAPFLTVIDRALSAGFNFTDAMIAGYSAVLCSPEFLFLRESPGRLDDYALATRLSFFLWNSPPDEPLRALAARGKLHRPEILSAQTDRLLNDPKSRRFVDAFLDYWLDLRRIVATAPDAALYPDYYLDDLLSESALDETQLFFNEVLQHDLPAANFIASDFAMLNERLALHYGVPGVQGIALQRVGLPPDSVRGGLLTQASVLKVTANGTTTSPVLRGAWIMERMLGQKPPPPPPSVPAVEPDIRGAVTIRQQLDKHRTAQSCSACHARIDPAGFALENFDVMGGWRQNYRALGEGGWTPGLGKNGQKFHFHDGQPVDASGELPDHRTFRDIREFKALLLADEKLIARNVAQQLTVFATGAPVNFSDRAEIERMLERTAASHYGVRSLVHALVESQLFLNK
jgi:Protein of unknown function (DUF1592)/Protein of unknown function (DUF1588)/Protein of unknown function (DUF1587)/Protein of unknown function (DUF1585)/Protein of unknown function (DUF1595)/Planctomycete cytochrome C